MAFQIAIKDFGSWIRVILVVFCGMVSSTLINAEQLPPGNPPAPPQKTIVVEPKPRVPIITIAEQKMFPKEWLDAPISARATSLSRGKTRRTINVITQALGLYDVHFLSRIKRIYVLGSLTLNGIQSDATTSAETIYIVNSSEEDYTDEYLRFIFHRAFTNWIEKNNARDRGAADVVRFLPQRRLEEVVWADRSMKLVYQADERSPEYIYALENTGFMGVALFKQFKHSPREDEITCLLRCRERSRRKALGFQEGVKEHEPSYHQTTVDSAPVWSHDGKQIAFQSSRDHDIAELYVMKVDGSKLRRLTHTAYSPSFSTVHSSAVWSPDDRQLAYLDAGSRLFIVNADGTGRRDLPIENTGMFIIGWLHDGRILILVERSDRSRSVYSILPNGTGLTRLIDGAHVVAQAFLSPNKNLIAIAAMGSLIIKDLRTNTVSHTIISLGIREVSWSPDSNQIAYQNQRSLVVRDLRTGATRYSSIGRLNEAISGISWSPDSKQIAYVGVFGLSSGRASVSELRVVNADGTGERRIAAEGYLPTWSPDGRYIVFSRLQARMFLIKPDGSGEQYLASGVWPKWIP